MDDRSQRAGIIPALNPPPDEPSEEEELRMAFGRVLGFTIAAIVLVLGGGVLVLVIAAIFFGFLYGQ
ncbi:MAG: hypothetical protein E6I88_02975 [Chloroflexi bacterium]|nr:MAG: hypothetical protein E6I88_02975 [Chloroflexota bacterium]TME47667.1 MAG: hypothetical protein E6I56_03455 [Chloroflexota bacterium]